MKQITIDRFDGIYAICEDKDKAFFAIETSELPQGAKAGDAVSYTHLAACGKQMAGAAAFLCAGARAYAYRAL